MKIDVLVFAKPAQGCMCEVYQYPLELFLCPQIDQGDRTEAKPSLVFPTAMVVKVKDPQTKRNKASVAHTGWNKRKKTSTTTPKKVRLVRLYSSSLQAAVVSSDAPPPPPHARRTFFISVVQPDLEYAALTFTPSMNAGLRNRLLAVWRKAIRCAAGVGYQDEVTPLLSEFRLTNIVDRWIVQFAC